MSEQFVNNVINALAEDLDISETGVDVEDGTLFPSTGTFRIIVGSEIMLVTARSGDTLTVTRGAEGTAAAVHTTGDAVTCILTAGAVTQLISDTVAAALVAAGVIFITGTSAGGAASAAMVGAVLPDGDSHDVQVDIVSRNTSTPAYVTGKFLLVMDRVAGTLTLKRSTLLEELGQTTAGVLAQTPFSGDVDAAMMSAAFGVSAGAPTTVLDPVGTDNWKHSVKYTYLSVSNS